MPLTDEMIWVAGTGLIAGVFGFAAVVLWLLERVSTVPPHRRRTEEGAGSATDAAIILGGGLVVAAALLEPHSAPWLVTLGLALVALGAVPFQRTPARRGALRLSALLLLVTVYALHYLGDRPGT